MTMAAVASDDVFGVLEDVAKTVRIMLESPGRSVRSVEVCVRFWPTGGLDVIGDWKRPDAAQSAVASE